MTIDDDMDDDAPLLPFGDNLAGSNAQGVHDTHVSEVGTPSGYEDDDGFGEVDTLSGDEDDDEVGEEDNGVDDEFEDDDNETQYGQPPFEQCFRQFYICPSQGRYFGDRGSLVDFFDPIARGEDFCARRSIPPYGPMVVWRVLSNFDCERDCVIYDDDLEEPDDISSIPILFRQTASGNLHSDRLISEGSTPRSSLSE